MKNHNNQTPAVRLDGSSAPSAGRIRPVSPFPAEEIMVEERSELFQMVSALAAASVPVRTQVVTCYRWSVIDRGPKGECEITVARGREYSHFEAVEAASAWCAKRPAIARNFEIEVVEA